MLSVLIDKTTLVGTGGTVTTLALSAPPEHLDSWAQTVSHFGAAAVAILTCVYVVVKIYWKVKNRGAGRD